MPNVRLTIEYDGSKFSGWQKQPNVRSVQSELERALNIALKEEVETLYASGRTDAGVHARGQVVNFFIKEEADLFRLKHSVSSILKGELSVLKAEYVPDYFNSQNSAKSKQYSYTILYRAAPAVLDYGCVWHIAADLDVDRMQLEAAKLVGEHDFTSFRATGCASKSAVREIYESEVFQRGEYLIYRVVGAGFLKQMVRNIVGTLVGFGKGTIGVTSMEQLLNLKDRTRAGMTAPAHGLCLDWVEY